MTRKEMHAQLRQLPQLKRPERLLVWKQLFGHDAPKGLRPELMVPILAYRIQEREYGGLKSETIARLRKIAIALEKNPKAKIVEEAHERPGARICRMWRGKTYEVTTTADGFQFEGFVYSSLSEIARLITGTRWSGPAFFGLKQTRKKSEAVNG